MCVSGFIDAFKLIQLKNFNLGVRERNDQKKSYKKNKGAVWNDDQ